jgi:hypothetical protein
MEDYKFNLFNFEDNYTYYNTNNTHSIDNVNTNNYISDFNNPFFNKEDVDVDEYENEYENENKIESKNQ